MKQVIHINYQGRVVPIEQTAFDLLKSYTDSLSIHFDSELGKEEIMHDIKDRIAELFDQRLKKGTACITDEDVNAIINSIGRIEDLKAAEVSDETEPEQKTTNQQTASSKRLYRDETKKIIGGVCAGLAQYFKVDVVVIRVIAAILFFSYGVGLIPYLVLWIAVPASSAGSVVMQQKKLFRDEDNKLIGGVCAGLAGYFGIDIWIPRIVFLLPLATTVFAKLWYWGVLDGFVPGAFIVYIICWIVIPAAKTTSEKLTMKGEPVNMDSIQKTIHTELKSAEKSIEKAAQKLDDSIKEKAPGFLNELGMFLKKIVRGLVSVFLTVAKIVAYFIMVVVAIALIAALFSMGLSTFGLWELKDFVLAGNNQTYLLLGTIIFFILVPVIGLLIWIIRRIFKLQKQRAFLRISFISSWILGWVLFFFLIALIGREFKKEYTSSAMEMAVKPFQSDTLLLQDFYRETENHFSENEFRLSSIIDIDSIHYEGVKVKIRKSKDNQFHIFIQKKTFARDLQTANVLFESTVPEIIMKDSLLLFNPRIGVSRQSKLRAQRAEIIIDVPEGKFVQVPGHSSSTALQNESWSFEDFDSGELPSVFQMLGNEFINTREAAPKNPAIPGSDSIRKEIIKDSLLKVRREADEKLKQLDAIEFQSLQIPIMLFDPLGFLP